LQDFLGHRAVRLYEHNPALGGAVNKTFKYIVPRLALSRERGASMMNATHSAIQSELDTYIHNPNTVIVVSGLLVYGLICIPLVVTFWLLASIRGVMKLMPILLFCHVYFLIAGLVAMCAALALQMDPLTTLQQDHYAAYLFTQGLFALFYVFYALLGVFAFCASRSRTERFVRIGQMVVSIFLGSAYYQLVWTPAMLDLPPAASAAFEGNGLSRPLGLALPYGMWVIGFAITLLMERVSRRSRSQKAIDEDRISVSVEMAATLEEGGGGSDGRGEKQA
jgi:hypothetical protein